MRLEEGALTIAVLTFVMVIVFALVYDARLDTLEDVEIHTALTCEQVQGVVVCVERP